MVKEGCEICPQCGGKLKYLDKCKRIVKTTNGEKHWIYLRELKCIKCGKLHRELPDYLLPYKHYEKEVISGVIEGLINSDTLGYEDYPCEMQMSRWIANANAKNSPGEIFGKQKLKIAIQKYFYCDIIKLVID